MSIFEVIVLLFLTIFFLILFIKKEKRPVWFAWLPILILLAVILHFIMDGPRWQMYTPYALAAIIGLRSLIGRSRKTVRDLSNKKPNIFKRAISIIGALLGLAAIALSAFIANIFPIPTQQAPSGQYEVGTRYLHFIDSERKEISTADTSDHRSLLVQVWYPASSTESFERAMVLPESKRYMSKIFKKFGLPPFAASHLESVKSFSFLEAPIISGNQSLPIILYSHGLLGNLSGNTHKMEELASHGYVVFSVAHSYGTQISLKEDGTWLTALDPKILRPQFKMSTDSAANVMAEKKEEAIFKRVESPIKLNSKDRKNLR